MCTPDTWYDILVAIDTSLAFVQILHCSFMGVLQIVHSFVQLVVGASTDVALSCIFVKVFNMLLPLAKKNSKNDKIHNAPVPPGVSETEMTELCFLGYTSVCTCVRSNNPAGFLTKHKTDRGVPRVGRLLLACVRALQHNL